MFKSPTGKQINSVGPIVHSFTIKHNPHMILTYYKMKICYFLKSSAVKTSSALVQKNADISF